MYALTLRNTTDRPCLLHRAIEGIKTFAASEYIEKKTNTKLSNSKKAKIRADAESGLYTVKQVADMHGTTSPTVQKNCGPNAKFIVNRLKPSKIKRIKKLHAEGMTPHEIATFLRISKSSAYLYATGQRG